MKFSSMNFNLTFVTFVCWFMQSIANIYISPEFSDHINESLLQCEDNVLSINFSNAVIDKIGPNFISSSLITCLDLRDNNIREIAKGTFDKLPNLTNLYLSNNKFGCDLFAFGSHQTLKILIINNICYTKYNNNYYVLEIYGIYPNLEVLSVHNNYFNDLIFSREERHFNLLATYSNLTQKTPFPKLKTLDLSNNAIYNINFINLLPESLMYLYLQNNDLESFYLKNENLITLTLDNNKLMYLRLYSNNLYAPGLWLAGLKNLRYLSVSRNNIRNIESIAFRDTNKLIHLKLSMNDIDNLYPETFERLPSLKTLDLNNNNLQNIPNISSETNITILSLSYNKIEIIIEHAFAWTPKLKELSLSENKISAIDVNGFSNLFYLEMLDLSNNDLTFLPEKWTVAFHTLKYLDLSYNKFTSLESLSLTTELPLMKMYLEMNPLEYLDAKSVENLPQNLTINLIKRSYKLRTMFQRFRLISKPQ